MTERTLRIALGSLWIAVLVSSAGAVYLKHQSRMLFVELEKLTQERDDLNIAWGRLQLEQGTYSAHALVEQVASRELHMTIPSATEVKIVQP
jgi:cell division protein FtsL